MASINYLVCAAGGGGGDTTSGGGAYTHNGGGGGGGVQTSSWVPSGANSYTVTVGTGGIINVNANGSNGGDSSISGPDLSVTANGGGGGGARGTNGVNANGSNGGAGGGGGGGNKIGSTSGGTGGNAGGTGASGTDTGAGGGGGSTAVGGNAGAGGSGSSVGGNGGAGTTSSISNSSVVYGSGGGGAGATPGTGGTNAGNGANSASGVNATSPVANRGGGGGGACQDSGGTGRTGTAGADGVVIFSYVTGTFTATGGTITTGGGNTIHTFTAGGTFAITGGPVPDGGFNHQWPNPVRKKYAGWRTNYQHPVNLPIVTPAVTPVDGALAVIIAGVDKTTSIQFDSITIRDVLNQPSTALFNTINGYQPINGQDIIIKRGTITLMAGYITTVNQTYLLRPGIGTSGIIWNVTAIDRTYMLRKRVAFGNYINVSATWAIRDLLMRNAPQFRGDGVQNGLPNITTSFDGTVDTAAAITQICNLVGAGWSTGDDFNVNVSTQAAAQSVNNIVDGDGYTLNDSPIQFVNDITQIRDRVFVKGLDGQLASDIASGETLVPIISSGVFSTVGGQAIIAPNNQISYTGVQPGTGGSVVGPGVTPANAPSLALASGAGVDSGTHQYAVVYRTTNDTTLSLPSPTASITTGQVGNPGAAPIGVLIYNDGIDVGTHQYAVTFGDGSGGETTPGSSFAVTTWKITPPTETPTVATGSSWAVGGFTPGTLVHVGLTLNASFYSGETTIGNHTDYTVVALGGGSATVNITLPSPSQSAPSGPLYYKIYASSDLVNWYQVGSGFGGTVASSVVLGVGGFTVPTTNTLRQQEVDISSIPVGPSGVALRKLYRTVAGGSQLKLLTTINNNTTTTFNDTIADASLGANAPGSNTTALNWVVVGNIPVGPSGTTQRWVYRTVAGGTALLLAFKVTDNTTTSATDTATDASLGAAAPTVDSSGLSQPSGVVTPGSSSIVVAGTGTFFISTGGWAIVGNGAQTVRYTGVTNSSITGIPATGIGSITAAINYGSTITAAAALTGCVGVLAAIKGTNVNIFAQRDNVVAQLALAAIEGGDGIHEHTIQDPSLVTNDAIIAAGDAELNLFAYQIPTFKYSTRDMLTHSGKNVSINLINPPIAANLVIQDVTITQLWWTGGGPLYTVQASTTKFTLQDLLAQISSANGGTAAI